MPNYMRKLVIVLLVLALFVLAACSKGNVITGQTIADTESAKETVKEVDQDDSTDDEVDPEPEEEAQEELLSDAETPDYSDSKGTCTVDNAGVVRHIDEDGLKTVYRNDCLGDKLVKYGCENNEMTTDLENCARGCEIVKYAGRCA